MIKSHILGFPRLGPDREYKKAVEAYWNGKISQEELVQKGATIRKNNWQIQQDAGLDYVTVGDFAWYDHILNLSVMFGVIPPRFVASDDANATTSAGTYIDTMFRMARGRAPQGKDAPACEMTKWFNTNYHYLVPEFAKNQQFNLSDYHPILDHTDEAQQHGHQVKASIVGPLSYLWLGKCADDEFDKLSLLDDLCAAYSQVLQQLRGKGIEWVQIDEPILALDLPQAWRDAYSTAYNRLGKDSPKIILSTYFGDIKDNFSAIANLPVAGLHLDTTRTQNWREVADQWDKSKLLSLGVINGRDVWRANLQDRLELLTAAKQEFAPAELWIGSSCSLMHSPVDLDSETKLDDELKQWLAFAKQKCREVALLSKSLNGDIQGPEQQEITDNATAAQARKVSSRIHKEEVAQRMKSITPQMMERASPFPQRAAAQKEHIRLPKFPTTTIGSFPQTAEIRSLRGKFKRGAIDEASYTEAMRKEIAAMVAKQEDIGLDVLVHGEPERNDMVEYFGELLDGVAVTGFGWVQSYGSRCVKPPIIYGDVTRPEPMTVPWSAYAKEVSSKPMKAMLTGPVTILFWSFVRDDISLADVTRQLALTLRDEVVDLEKNGMQVIQIDEPALREGLPLRQDDWPTYLKWAVEAFRLSASGVGDGTQIHTHMCYSKFNDIMDSIAALDADVISIECSRSRMELLDVFDEFNYPNEIGPGVYDIHSPLVPSVDEMEQLLQEATKKIPAERLWVNPDCGLKTRQWPETEAALKNMVVAAANMRAKYNSQ